MRLTFKNSTMVSLDKNIKKAIDARGIPKHVEVYPDEAIKFLKEIASLVTDQEGEKLVARDIKINTTSELPAVFSVGKLIDELGSKNMMFKWKDGEYDVKYKNIPLIVAERRGK